MEFYSVHCNLWSNHSCNYSFILMTKSFNKTQIQRSLSENVIQFLFKFFFFVTLEWNRNGHLHFLFLMFNYVLAQVVKSCSCKSFRDIVVTLWKVWMIKSAVISNKERDWSGFIKIRKEIQRTNILKRLPTKISWFTFIIRHEFMWCSDTSIFFFELCPCLRCANIQFMDGLLLVCNFFFYWLDTGRDIKRV